MVWIRVLGEHLWILFLSIERNNVQGFQDDYSLIEFDAKTGDGGLEVELSVSENEVVKKYGSRFIWVWWDPFLEGN